MAANGIVSIPSKHGVDQSVENLRRILEARAVKVFTIVDHSGEAAAAGLKMPNTKLVIFGNPKAGTPVMLAAPTAALDLPLKILIWQDGEGKTWLTYNGVDYLRERHNVPADLMPNLAVIDALAAKAAE